VEKHTFDIFADYKDYARGSARASVAVSGEGDDFGPGIGGFSDWPWYIGGAVVLFIIYVIFKSKRKRR
jgi:hypothetical protein